MAIKTVQMVVLLQNLWANSKIVYLLKHSFFSSCYVYDRYKQNKMFGKTWLLSKGENGLVTCQIEAKTHINIGIFQQKLACGA